MFNRQGALLSYEELRSIEMADMRKKYQLDTKFSRAVMTITPEIDLGVKKCWSFNISVDIRPPWDGHYGGMWGGGGTTYDIKEAQEWATEFIKGREKMFGEHWYTFMEPELLAHFKKHNLIKVVWENEIRDMAKEREENKKYLARLTAEALDGQQELLEDE